MLTLALAKDPARRYPSAAALRDDLKRVVRLPDDARPIRPEVAFGGAPVPPPPPTEPARHFYALAPPTPTPTPGPLSQAPPAPSLAPSSAPSPPPPPRSRRARRWVPVAAGAVVLALGAGVLVAVLQGRSDPGGREGADGPGGSSVSAEAARADEAVTVLSGAFATVAGVDEESGACIAQQLVDDIGVDGLIEAGVIDEDLTVLDDDLEDSAVKSAIVSATVTCTGLGG